MAKPALTAPARLTLLLPWLNGDLDDGRSSDFLAIRHAIAEFLRSFDGSAAAGHLEVIDDPAPPHVRRLSGQGGEPTDEELDDLGARLRILLAQGFGDGLLGDVSAASGTSIDMPDLRISVRNTGRRKPAKRGSIIVGGVTAQRDYRRPGAYVLQVRGPLIQLVPFLAAHLLSAPDMLAVKRCERSGCEHFVVEATAARGRPRQFCSKSCRERNAEQRELQRKRRRLQR
jgi:hypothetical protein